MNTPVANKTTISSRNKMAQLNGGQQEILTAQSGIKIKNNMPPPSQIARNRALPPKAPLPQPTSRLASLATGFPSCVKDAKPIAITRDPTLAEPPVAGSIATTRTLASAIQAPKTTCKTIFRHTNAPQTTLKDVQKTTIRTAAPSTSSRIVAPRSRLNGFASLNSRSSSVVSSASSTPAMPKQTKAALLLTETHKQQTASSNHVPYTNTVRKGSAKYSNPMECKRQIEDLILKIIQRDKDMKARTREVDALRGRLNEVVNIGTGYATVVQYFATKLKLDSELDLLEECEQLKSQINELTVEKDRHQRKIDTVLDVYESQLQVERDLKDSLQRKLEETCNSHSEYLEGLKNAHKVELDELNAGHSAVVENLQHDVERLRSELETKCKELSDLLSEHEHLTGSYNRLEESLNKDKDARVKHAQEKISQLKKDVESLNSVLEMRLERIHALEKDSILLTEVQNELITQQDTNKALSQQVESLNAALVKKREQMEKLIAEHENIRQELKKERSERRRMTMKTEQLEYVLNESCASESTMVFNSSIRDLDNGTDNLI